MIGKTQDFTAAKARPPATQRSPPSYEGPIDVKSERLTILFAETFRPSRLLYLKKTSDRATITHTRHQRPNDSAFQGFSC
jgi:hypothetical protein